MRVPVGILALCGAMLCTGGAAAQQGASCKPAAMPGMTMDGETAAVPPEKLPPPIALSGIGNSSLEITTASPEARVWFTQGLNLLHDFWDYESSRAFEQSVRADPQCAMCFWGLYQAETFRGDNDASAGAALDQAQRLAKHATPAEQLYIKAAAQSEKQRLADKAADAKKQTAPPGSAMWQLSGVRPAKHVDSKETKTLRKLVARNPDDTQAKIFLAESLIDGFDKNANPKPGTAQAQTILAAVLAAHPDDSAANHYWIHAQEPGQHPESALPSARKLGTLTPASGHMVHMPGHIFYRTGDYENARLSFENSMHVDEAYMRVQGVSVNDDWNYVHNLMYLIADLLEAGRMQEATAISAKLTEARGTSKGTLYLHSTRDGMTRLNPLLPVALRSAEWSRATQLLEASEPDPTLVNLAGLRDSLLAYTRGMASLAAGDTPAADTQSKALDARLAKTPAEAQMSMPGMGGAAKPNPRDAMPGPIHSFMDVAALELRAAVQMAQGEAADADATFTKASDAERSLGYREPPYYIRPVAETLGDSLMRAHRFLNARTAYQGALAERPNSGFALFGIAQADAAEHDQAAAAADYRALLTAWKNADPGLPQVTAAQTWLRTRNIASGQ